MNISYGNYAFADCNSLTSVSLSNNIKSIGTGCFKNTGLTSFTCPSGITSLPKEVCHNCHYLKTVNLSTATSLSSIGEDAFSEGVSTYYVPVNDPLTGVPTIYEVTMTESNLTSVTLPKSVSTLGKKAFANNYLLEAIQTNPTLTATSFSKKFIFNVNDSYKTSLTTIPERAFAFCYGLRHVSLPSSVTSLGTYAFYNTPNLNYFQAPGLTYVYAEALKGRCESDIKLANCTKVGSLYKEADSEGIYFTKAPLNN
jgi:hypothetical protein